MRNVTFITNQCAEIVLSYPDALDRLNRNMEQAEQDGLSEEGYSLDDMKDFEYQNMNSAETIIA